MIKTPIAIKKAGNPFLIRITCFPLIYSRRCCRLELVSPHRKKWGGIKLLYEHHFFRQRIFLCITFGYYSVYIDTACEVAHINFACIIACCFGFV